MSLNETKAIEAIRAVYYGINNNAALSVIKFLDPEIVRIEPEGFPSSGTYRGHEELLDHLSQSSKTWAEGSCEPERFQISGNKVVAFIHVHVRLKEKTDWIDARIADVFTFKNDKIIEMRTFEKNEDAIEWVKTRV